MTREERNEIVFALLKKQTRKKKKPERVKKGG